LKVFIISILLSLYAFYLVLINNDKKAIFLIIFSIPIFYYPLENSKLHIGINIGMSGMIILATWLAMKFKGRNTNWKNLSPNFPYLYYLLLAGIILGLVYQDFGLEYMGGRYFNILSPMQQILNNSIFILLVILFLKILSPFQYDIHFLETSARIFSYSIFLQVFSQFLKIIGYEDILFGLLSSGGVYNSWDVRNFGLWGGFGLGVYVVLIISFSLLYYYNNKKVSLLCILLVLIYSFVTNQRQTIAFIILFFILFILINMIRNKLSISHFLLLFVLSTSVLFIWKPALSKISIFRRFAPAIESINDGLILEASGRNVKALPFVIADLKNYPLTGRGLLNLGNTAYSNTNLAGHVVWFNIYQKLGIAGVIYLLFILIIPICKLCKIALTTRNTGIFHESSILFSLVVVVFIQQFWDNFFSFSNTMLLYAFIYFWGCSFFNRVKLMEI
jgi:hypothetical protein